MAQPNPRKRIRHSTRAVVQLFVLSINNN
jgi:hypothetical protein